MATFFDRLLGRKTSTLSGAEQRTTFDADDVVMSMLKKLQARWTTTSHTETTDFAFDFQGGHFHLITRRGHHWAYLQYPCFDDTPLGLLSDVRSACNRFNMEYPDYTAIYTISAEENKVRLHLGATIRLSAHTPDLEEDFRAMLVRTFGAARTCAGYLRDAIAEKGDGEEYFAFTKRERFLAAEMEMQEGFDLMRTHDTSHLMLRDLLAMVKGYDVDSVQTVKVLIPADTSSDNPLSTIDAVDFDITRLLFAKDDEGNPVAKADEVALMVSFVCYGHMERLLIYLRKVDEIDDVYYYRVEVVAVGDIAGPSHSLDAGKEDPERHVSLLMSYSPKPFRAKLSEFEYIHKEAKDKAARGQELNKEEEFMLLCENADVSFDLYWGVRNYLSRNYYQAVLHLENAYKALTPRFHDLDKDDRKRYFDLCYYLGVCFLRMERPKLAYYYLDGLFNLNNINYTKAYINAMVKSRDRRAFGVINGVLNNIQRLLNEADAPNEEMHNDLQSFALFLRRAKAYTLCDMNKLEEAERELRRLLEDDKPHETYLLRLLANVVNRRAEQAAKSAPDSLSVSSEFPKVAPSDTPGSAAGDAIE